MWICDKKKKNLPPPLFTVVTDRRGTHDYILLCLRSLRGYVQCLCVCVLRVFVSIVVNPACTTTTTTTTIIYSINIHCSDRVIIIIIYREMSDVSRSLVKCRFAANVAFNMLTKFLSRIVVRQQYMTIISR